MQTGSTRKTPLNAFHRELGAKMVPFGGWDMPAEYSGLIDEHMAVRTAAGLFDVSHMGEIAVEGPGAAEFLQRVTCNDVCRLVDGEAQHSAITLPNGAAVDDLVVHRHGPEKFLLVVNATNVEKDLRWLLGQNPVRCEVRDRSDEWALLALQGPRAQQILQRLVSAELSDLQPCHFTAALVDGTVPVVVSRTGYTGEDGFEVFVEPLRAEAVWRRTIEAGKDDGLLPAGLGARDTLRLEARMCLYGNDVDESTTLLEAGLGSIVCLDDAKGDFPGRSVLAEQQKSGPPRKLVGFEVVGRGIARQGYPAFFGPESVGAVTSGTYAPFLKKNIGLVYLPARRSADGTEFDIDVRGRRVAARVVPTPFYKRDRGGPAPAGSQDNP